MKKLISLLLAASMLLALSACSMEKISEIKLPPRPGTAEAKEAEASGPEETGKTVEPEQATTVEAMSFPDPETEETVQDTPEEQEITEEEEPEVPDEEEPKEIAEPEPAEETAPSDEQTSPEPEPTPAVQPKPEPSSPATVERPVQSPMPAEVPVITISHETKPGNVARYKSQNIFGIIETNCGVITQVYAVIMDDRGEPVQDCAYYPNKQSFDLADSVNYCLRFGRLEQGNYVYQLNASAANGGITVSETLMETAFSVSAPAQTQTESPAESGSNEEAPMDPSQYSARQTDDGSNAGQIWNYLIAQMNNPFAAAGILGNIQAESSCLPYAVENDTSKGRSFSLSYTEAADNGTISRDIFAYSPPGDSLGYGFGLCQWSMERKGNLYDYAKDNGLSLNSIDTQCGFLMMELNTYFPSLLEDLKTCTDARDACRRFCTDFEKAAVWGGRTDYAMDYLEKYAKN